jgi:hypothetical protein
MGSLSTFFMFIATVVPIVLIVWFLFSWLGRMGRAVEDIALTLRRIEQSLQRPAAHN